MKTPIILIILLFLTSCTQQPKSVTEDSTKIVSDYVDTLENSIGDARSVVKDMNERNSKIK